MESKSKIKILTWHVHGSYLYYLTQANCDFYLPYNDVRSSAYGGKNGSFPWGDNVHEVHVDDVGDLDIDCILFQSNYRPGVDYFAEQYSILSESQKKLPKLFLEHDPPRESPTDTKHIISDPNITIVHCTHFNDLMWNNNNAPSVVIDHGVVVPSNIRFTGEIDRGIAVVNNIHKRGRRLGYDIFERVRKEVPIDIVGMGSEEIGGLGNLAQNKLLETVSKYRFFFNPIRYTSLGLSILEAMMVGMPIIGLATTELVTVISNGISGYIDTNIDTLINKMNILMKDKDLAMKLGKGAQKVAMQRFNIHRFTHDWEQLFLSLIYKNRQTMIKSRSINNFTQNFL